jgi:hypothetical protein
MTYSEGDMLVLTKDIRTDAGYVLLMNGDPEVLQSDYQQVVDWQRTMFQVVEDSDSHGDGDGDGDGDRNSDHDGNRGNDSDRDMGHDHDMTAATSRATSIPSNDLGSTVADTLVTPHPVSSSSSSSSSSLQMSSVINNRRGIALLSRIMTNGTILCACYLLFMSLFTIGLPFFKFAIIKKK